MDTATEIEQFISKRFRTNCAWNEGNCLWFALILQMRFRYLKIYYLPAEGHFIVGSLGEFYDWTGRVEPDEMPIPLKDIEESDNPWYQRLLADCFM